MPSKRRKRLSGTIDAVAVSDGLVPVDNASNSHAMKSQGICEMLERRLMCSTYNQYTLASFNGTNGVNTENGLTVALTADSSGNLFGVTAGGGAYSDGAVFEIAQGTSTITPLASFNGSNGAAPTSALAIDSSGNLFGITPSGGSGYGTAFEVVKNSGTITTLYTFNQTTGADLSGAVIDSSDDLFGSTGIGGTGVYSEGFVFEIPHHSSTMTLLASFNGSNGPVTAIDSSSNLFGTQIGYVSSDNGSVFEVVHNSGLVTRLGTSFASLDGLVLPGVIIDSSDDVFGAADGTNSHGTGTLFEIVHGSSSTSTIGSFSGTSASDPYGGVALDSSGDLFGASFGGTSGDGTVFEVPSGSGTIDTLANFASSAGQMPTGATLDPSGDIYGVTALGGTSGDGTVYLLTPNPLTVVANTLTLPASATAGISVYTYSGISINSGASLLITSPTSHPSRVLLVTSGLTLAGGASNWTSTLNLGGNDLMIHNGNITAVTGQLQSGFGSGSWSGQGISSSAAASDSTHLTALGAILNSNSVGAALYPNFDGQTAVASDVLVKYTYYGDCNLDGVVDGSDYSRIDTAYLQNLAHPGTLTGWYNGDFNYDGVVNGSDYALIDNSYNRQRSSLAAQVAETAKTPTPNAPTTTLVNSAAPLEQDSNDRKKNLAVAIFS